MGALVACCCAVVANLQMILDAPEQEAAMRTDALRQMMGQISNTPAARIFVYQTRTINNPTGQPSTAVS